MMRVQVSNSALSDYPQHVGERIMQSGAVYRNLLDLCCIVRLIGQRILTGTSFRFLMFEAYSTDASVHLCNIHTSGGNVTLPSAICV